LNPAFVNKVQEAHTALQPRRVHTITDRFAMVNTYLINDERMVVVDPVSELNVQLLSKYIERILHRTPAEIDLIVLTHLHPDHSAGVAALRRICKAPVAASSVLRQLNLFPLAHIFQRKCINIWLDDVAGLPFHLDWRIIASPGHTPESLCLYNPFTYELLCGDTVITVEGRAPLLRRGSNLHQLEELLQILRSLQVYYLYPGYGRPILGLCPLCNITVEW
jgi:glyoxylase-like metal-dependent hydrolase (beta-lactamase superfamily II)